MKKLIFLRNGCFDYFELIGNKKPNNSYDLDLDIKALGYKKVQERIRNNFETYEQYEYFYTTCPTVLNMHDCKADSIWWDKDKNFWQIFFVEEGKPRNIQEYTDRELRMAHNIEHLYLRGGLDDWRLCYWKQTKRIFGQTLC